MSIETVILCDNCKQPIDPFHCRIKIEAPICLVQDGKEVVRTTLGELDFCTTGCLKERVNNMYEDV
jgi:hypothetical protein